MLINHLLSPKRVAVFDGFRGDICLKVVDEMKGLMVENGEVELRKVLHFRSLNNGNEYHRRSRCVLCIMIRAKSLTSGKCMYSKL